MEAEVSGSASEKELKGKLRFLYGLPGESIEEQIREATATSELSPAESLRTAQERLPFGEVRDGSNHPEARQEAQAGLSDPYHGRRRGES